MKKTCFKCKALNRICCDLGYKFKIDWKQDKKTGDLIKYITPEEECPKPRIWKEYIKCTVKHICKNDIS